MKKYELTAMYSNQNSFGGKAVVIEVGNKLILQSYKTEVAHIEIDEHGNKKAYVIGTYSNTTSKHIKEFLKQNDFKADNMKQILKDYKKEN